jgi:hypothetical protein
MDVSAGLLILNLYRQDEGRCAKDRSGRFNRILRWLIDRLSRFLRLRAQMLF